MRSFLFMLAVSGTLAVSAAACGKGGTPPVSTNATADSADQVMMQVRSNMTNDGVRRGVLFADTAYVFDQNSRFDFRGVRTEFMTPTGAQDGTMTARRGTYNLRSGVLEAFGDVRIVTEDGRRLDSPHLRYDQGRNLVSSDSAFVMVHGDRTQRGVGFEADPQLTRFQCKASCGGSAPITIPID
jgi:LPS export ABC transporter protein LptC